MKPICFVATCAPVRLAKADYLNLSLDSHPVGVRNRDSNRDERFLYDPAMLFLLSLIVRALARLLAVGEATAARMQAATSGPAPILLRQETKAGHGQGKPRGLILDEQTDIWSFLFWQLGM